MHVFIDVEKLDTHTENMNILNKLDLIQFPVYFAVVALFLT